MYVCVCICVCVCECVVCIYVCVCVCVLCVCVCLGSLRLVGVVVTSPHALKRICACDGECVFLCRYGSASYCTDQRAHPTGLQKMELVQHCYEHRKN